MERVQTILRIDNALMKKAKAKASAQNQSFNSYVVMLLTKDLSSQDGFPKVKIPTEISDDVKSLGGIAKFEITDRMLEEDDRLAYILSK